MKKLKLTWNSLSSSNDDPFDDIIFFKELDDLIKNDKDNQVCVKKIKPTWNSLWPDESLDITKELNHAIKNGFLKINLQCQLQHNILHRF